jgi:hypothetical protein
MNAELVMIFGKQVSFAGARAKACVAERTQDTHVPRAGRDLIRKTLEDANVTFSVSDPQIYWILEPTYHIYVVARSSGTARIHSRRAVQGPLGRCVDQILLQFHDGG